jgi:CBS domain-containing protein
MKKVKDFMTREVEVARPEMTIREAAEILRSMNIGSLPVCDGNRVVGIITDRDIAVRVVAEGKDCSQTRVEDAMSKDRIVAVNEDASIKEAEQKMHDEQLRRLPVVDSEGRLVGYLAQAKIARMESSGQAGKVLKGISQPEKPESMESFSWKRKTA